MNMNFKASLLFLIIILFISKGAEAANEDDKLIISDQRLELRLRDIAPLNDVIYDSKLKSLSVMSLIQDFSEIEATLEQLKRNTSITTLSLQGIIDDDRAAIALSGNSALLDLDLHWVPITIDRGFSGTIAMIIAGTIFGGLTSRIFGERAGRAVMEWSLSNPPLNSKITKRGAKALSTMARLRRLNLKDNDIDDEGAKFFLNHPNLIDLNLEGNPISSETKQLIADMLLRNKDVARFCLAKFG